MPFFASAGLPATLFSVVLAAVMVGSGLLFDRMAAVAPPAPVQVVVLDRPPPARVERVTAHWEEIAAGYPGLLAAPEPARLSARQAGPHENAPVRAGARRGEKKNKPVQPVFGPQTGPADPQDTAAGLAGVTR